MSRVGLGILFGLAAGTIDVLLMIPLKHADKKTAMMGAFASRFAIGFLAANVDLPCPPLVTGGIVGLLISIPDAIIVKVYAPILVTGTVFGAVSALLAHNWGS